MTEGLLFNGARYYKNGDYFWSAETSTSLHHAVWESVHGTLSPGMVIHHIDGDPENNSPDNLKSMPLSEHTKLHRELLKRNPLNRICVECGKQYLAESYRGSCCSRACSLRWWKRKTGRTGKLHSLNCQACGKAFLAKRKDTKWCSKLCGHNYWYEQNRDRVNQKRREDYART